MTADECKHGQLARACHVCELEAENARAFGQLDEAEKLIVEQDAALKTAEDEIMRLRDVIARAGVRGLSAYFCGRLP